MGSVAGVMESFTGLSSASATPARLEPSRHQPPSDRSARADAQACVLCKVENICRHHKNVYAHHLNDILSRFHPALLPTKIPYLGDFEWKQLQGFHLCLLVGVGACVYGQVVLVVKRVDQICHKSKLGWSGVLLLYGLAIITVVILVAREKSGIERTGHVTNWCGLCVISLRGECFLQRKIPCPILGLQIFFARILPVFSSAASKCSVLYMSLNLH